MSTICAINRPTNNQAINNRPSQYDNFFRPSDVKNNVKNQVLNNYPNANDNLQYSKVAKNNSYLTVPINNRCHTIVTIGSKMYICLVDSGATSSNYMSAKTYYAIKKDQINKSHPNPVFLREEKTRHIGCGAKVVETLGYTRLDFFLGDQRYSEKFVVFKEFSDNDGVEMILGLQFIGKYEGQLVVSHKNPSKNLLQLERPVELSEKKLAKNINKLPEKVRCPMSQKKYDTSLVSEKQIFKNFDSTTRRYVMRPNQDLPRVSERGPVQRHDQRLLMPQNLVYFKNVSTQTPVQRLDQRPPLPHCKSKPSQTADQKLQSQQALPRSRSCFRLAEPRLKETYTNELNIKIKCMGSSFNNGSFVIYC